MRYAVELQQRAAPRQKMVVVDAYAGETAPVSIPTHSDDLRGLSSRPNFDTTHDGYSNLYSSDRDGASLPHRAAPTVPATASKADELTSPGPCAESEVSAVSLLTLAIAAAGSAESASPRSDNTKQVLTYMCRKADGPVQAHHRQRSYTRDLVAAYISSPRLAKPCAAISWTCAAFLGVPCEPGSGNAVAAGLGSAHVVEQWIHRCISPRRAGPMPAGIAWEVVSGRTTLCLTSQHGSKSEMSQLAPWAAWLKRTLPGADTVWWPWTELEGETGGEIASAASQAHRSSLALVYVVAVRDEASLRCDSFASVTSKARKGDCKIILCLPPDFPMHCAQVWADFLSYATP